MKRLLVIGWRLSSMCFWAGCVISVFQTGSPLVLPLVIIGAPGVAADFVEAFRRGDWMFWRRDPPEQIPRDDFPPPGSRDSAG